MKYFIIFATTSLASLEKEAKLEGLQLETRAKNCKMVVEPYKIFDVVKLGSNNRKDFSKIDFLSNKFC